VNGMVSKCEPPRVSSRNEGTKDADRFRTAVGTDAPFSSVMGEQTVGIVGGA
jgi:hypothetical protein